MDEEDLKCTIIKFKSIDKNQRAGIFKHVCMGMISGVARKFGARVNDGVARIVGAQSPFFIPFGAPLVPHDHRRLSLCN